MSSSERSAYSRFIPREELGSFAAWRPGAVGDAAREAEAAPPPEWQARLDAAAQAARQAGYQDGYRDGLAALEAFKQNLARQAADRVGALVAGFDAELLALEERIAATVADCATQLARQVVRHELATAPERIAQVAQEAVATLLRSAAQIELRVHPDDAPLVEAGAGELLAARGARLVADASLARGGCRVESDIGSVDATVATRWQLACAALGTEPVLDGGDGI